MIQYPKLVHATLPSVDNWFVNTNILRDPPRSLTIPKREKVFDTNLINEMIDDSGSRVCEQISLYARGSNPMVSVSYDNFSNNAGMYGNPTSHSAKRQAFLPYRVAREGAFRPPVMGPWELLPLSRLPRTFTSVMTSSDFPNYASKMMCPSPESFKEIKTEVLNTCARPTAVYQLETPVMEPFIADYAINDNPIRVSATSGMRTMDITSQKVETPVKGVSEPLRTYINVNVGSDVVERENQSEMNTSKYIQEHPNYSEVNTNISRDLDVLPLENMVNSKISVKDILKKSHTTSIRGGEIEGMIATEEDLELARKIPTHTAQTNLSDNRIYKAINPQNTLELERVTPLTSFQINPGSSNNPNNMNSSSRDYRLNPTLSNVGSFANQGLRPTIERVQTAPNNFETQRNQLAKRAFSQFSDRFSNPSL